MLKDEILQPPLSRWSWFYTNEEERQSGGGERLKVTASAIFVDGFWKVRNLVRGNLELENLLNAFPVLTYRKIPKISPGAYIFQN